MKRLSTNDPEFLNSISTDRKLQRYYKKELKNRLRLARRQHRIGLSELKGNLATEISNREKHDEMVNMGILPFMDQPNFGEDLNYRLIACDPLYELKIPNFDFLITKNTDKQIITIFGDAKTSIDRPSRIISDILRKKEAVQNNESYIRDQFLEGTSLPIRLEYVVLVEASFSDEIRNEIENQGGGFIIWSADRHNSSIKLVNPGDNNKHRLSMLHADNKLNSMLGNIPGTLYASSLGFFPQSHIVTKMKSLIQVIEYSKLVLNRTYLTDKEIDPFFDNQLSYMTKKHRVVEKNEIIDNAIKIGFLEKGGKGYSVKKEYSSRSTQEKIISQLWISNQIKNRLEERIEEARLQLQHEVKAEFDHKPKIEQWFK